MAGHDRVHHFLVGHFGCSLTMHTQPTPRLPTPGKLSPAHAGTRRPRAGCKQARATEPGLAMPASRCAFCIKTTRPHSLFLKRCSERTSHFSEPISESREERGKKKQTKHSNVHFSPCVSENWIPFPKFVIVFTFHYVLCQSLRLHIFFLHTVSEANIFYAGIPNSRSP